MSVQEALPSVVERPVGRCGMSMWLEDSKRGAAGIECTFRCPVCEAVAQAVVKPASSAQILAA
jgi:hypothetical protein